ncbi:MAG: nicotinate (nicotinamide) nucleotide adenylyltransferase [Verrucomicrobia bacterium]|jgi:nicotinate-nucleotide adenylyltransferase|nr:nicotinate (nicotinamide) nucleotide adenylyltransferase [Verrucomicrobiota bacterium]MBT7067886.1 nicotinate (nicotinamide) nucleotide adenylyltransferase [Verrucomicrobiota bacterium]MBT7699354.1 nicotinate (nicotinamide) nucleotide adenylyltransferase [Verrucomicrobiota bacterium]
MGIRNKLGILGGSFNPIHTGHLILAQQALESYELDQVLFVPCALPPHKDPGMLLPGGVRLAMVQMALAGDPRFEASAIELERGGTSYAVDTLRQLTEMYPESDLYFIIGDDTLVELYQWHRIYDLLPLCTFVTFGRNREAIRPDALHLDPPWPARLLATATMARRFEVASSDIRHRVAEGMSIRYLVPDVIDMYIAEHHLYLGEC